MVVSSGSLLCTNNADCVSPVPRSGMRDSRKRFEFNRSCFRRSNSREIAAPVCPHPQRRGSAPRAAHRSQGGARPGARSHGEARSGEPMKLGRPRLLHRARVVKHEPILPRFLAGRRMAGRRVGTLQFVEGSLRGLSALPSERQSTTREFRDEVCLCTRRCGGCDGSTRQRRPPKPCPGAAAARPDRLHRGRMPLGSARMSSRSWSYVQWRPERI